MQFINIMTWKHLSYDGHIIIFFNWKDKKCQVIQLSHHNKEKSRINKKENIIKY